MKVGYLNADIVIISDAHLGKDSASAAALLEFLQQVKCKRLIIAGDFIDFWELGKRKHWRMPEMHIRILDQINKMVAEGVEAIYTPGNHEPELHQSRILGWEYFGIRFMQAYNFVLAGKRGRVSHGHEFDQPLTERAGELAHSLGLNLHMIGVYDFALRQMVNAQRRSFWGLGRKRSLSERLATMTPKQLEKALGNTDKCIMEEGHRDGIGIRGCGHSHQPRDVRVNGTQYINAGDWVQNRSAAIIDSQGNGRMVDWVYEREAFGLTAFPSEHDSNPAQAYRAVSLKQLRMIQRLSPGWKRRETLKEIARLEQRVEKKGELAALCNRLGAYAENLIREDRTMDKDRHGVRRVLDTLLCEFEEAIGRIEPDNQDLKKVRLDKAWKWPVERLAFVFISAARKLEREAQKAETNLAVERKKLRPWHDRSEAKPVPVTAAPLLTVA